MNDTEAIHDRWNTTRTVLPLSIADGWRMSIALENTYPVQDTTDVQTSVRATDFLAREREYKSNLGQFMTAPQTANFMAGLLTVNAGDTIRLLDAGAGLGALSCAVLDAWTTERRHKPNISVDAYEIDTSLIPTLQTGYDRYDGVKSRVFTEDFIEAIACDHRETTYTHAILNPPYKKIRSDSEHRKLLRDVGIETGNLYSAFVALALKRLVSGGQVVAIIPRSFCNGPYFKPFRKFILDEAAITHLHLFNSRTDVFKEDSVLQENIIIRLVRDAKQGDVIVSTSTDSSFSDLQEHTYPFDQIVERGDTDQFIHIPTQPEQAFCGTVEAFSSTPEDIEVSVSTGPVVGFRLKEHLKDMLDETSVPLVYPHHLKNGKAQWPLEDGKKPNAIAKNDATEKWLYPNGYYCVVRRFSSKEERHRIVASVITPETFGDAKQLGLDNKLNVFHFEKKGIAKDFAHGLAAFLNTDYVDDEFRRFSGHTQVNATDLRRLGYPSKETILKLGEWIQRQQSPSQADVHTFLGLKTTWTYSPTKLRKQ